MTLEQELDFAKGLAREAGQEIVRLASTATVEQKAGDEVVTSVDRAVDLSIRQEIARKYGRDGILTEESEDDLTRLDKRRLWEIDPIDGTVEFVRYLADPVHNPYFAVHIGLAVAGVARLGVVYAPVLDELFSARSGYGAFLEGQDEPLLVSTITDIERAHLLVKPSKEEDIACLGFADGKVLESMGLKICYVAAGRGDAYVAYPSKSKEWDSCAPGIILEEAGGKISDIDGNLIQYNKQDVYNRRGVLATNGLLHRHVQAMLNPC
jgi:fructose-1,6-bisphosphatase/inositol monophosphatase family enzyme